jgi:hypothetical protein
MVTNWCVEELVSQTLGWIQLFPTHEGEWAPFAKAIEELQIIAQVKGPSAESCLRLRGAAGSVYSAAQILHA